MKESQGTELFHPDHTWVLWEGGEDVCLCGGKSCLTSRLGPSHRWWHPAFPARLGMSNDWPRQRFWSMPSGYTQCILWQSKQQTGLFHSCKDGSPRSGAAGGFLLDLQALASTLGSQARSFALCVPGVNPCGSRFPPFLRPPGR